MGGGIYLGGEGGYQGWEIGGGGGEREKGVGGRGR